MELLQVVVEVEVEVAVAPAAASFGQIEGKRRCKLQMAAKPKRRVSWETEKKRERGRVKRERRLRGGEREEQARRKTS